MGGGQALTIDITNLDPLWLRWFSSGRVAPAQISTFASSFPIYFATSPRQTANCACCSSVVARRPRYQGHLDFVDDLKAQGLKPVWYSTSGAHEMKVWRHSLHEFLPRLFKRSNPT